LKNPERERSEPFFHTARRDEEKGRDLRLRSNDALWKKAAARTGAFAKPRQNRTPNNHTFGIRCRSRFFNRLLLAPNGLIIGTSQMHSPEAARDTPNVTLLKQYARC
jgi:hypothetical protein